MAELVPEQVDLVWSAGTSLERAALYALKGVSSGDTATLKEFRVVKFAGIVRSSGAPAAPAIAGTTITLPTGLNNDGVWLLALGVTA